MSRQQRVETKTDPIAYVIEPGLDAAHGVDTKTTTKKETIKKKPVVDTKTTTQKETTKKKPVVVSHSSNDDNNDDKDDSDDSEPLQCNKGGSSADLFKIGMEGFALLDEYPSRSNVRGYPKQFLDAYYSSRSNVQGYPKQGPRITNDLKRTNICP